MREAQLRANRTGQTDSGQSFTAEDHDEVEADLFEPEDEAHDSELRSSEASAAAVQETEPNESAPGESVARGSETGHSPQRAGSLEWQDTHEEPDAGGHPDAAPAAETKETRDE